jgi:protein TonB
MDASWGIRAWLFPIVLGVSALIHFVLVKNLAMPSGAQKMEFASGETTEVFIIEEAPPLPEPIPEPVATPEPQPEEHEPPKTEEILTTNRSEEVAAPQPTPQPKRIEKKPAPQRPPPVISPKVANVPAPVVIRNKPPFYPETARRSGWEGRVIVRVEVSAEGVPTSVTLAKSSGYGVLDQAALRSVKGWRFQPRSMGGIAMAGVVDVPVSFSLNR